MEKFVRVPLFKLSFWSNFPKLPTKWKKQAQKSSNIWHKPSWRCSRGPPDIFSSAASDQAKNSPASVCFWRTTNKKKPLTTKAGVQSGVSPAASTLSQGCLWQCGGQAVPFTQKQDTGFGTVSQSVSSGIPSWSDAKEEGTMEPATWCSEVPHLQWWCSTRSCLHNYGSSLCHVHMKKWWMWIWFNNRLSLRILPLCRMVSPINSKCATSFLELSAPDHDPISRSGRFPGRSTHACCSWHVALSHRFAG